MNTLNIVLLLNSYTIQPSPIPISRPNLPRPGKDSPDDSGCGQCESGLSGLGQEHLPPSCLGLLNSTGRQTKLAKMRGTEVRMAVQSEGARHLPCLSPTCSSVASHSSHWLVRSSCSQPDNRKKYLPERQQEKVELGAHLSSPFSPHSETMVVSKTAQRTVTLHLIQPTPCIEHQY